MAPRQIINTIPDHLEYKEMLHEFYLVESGCCTDLQTQNISMRTKSELQICYIAGGKGTISVSNKTHIVQQNDVVFQTHQHPVRWTSSPALPMELWWIDLRGPALSALVEKLSVNESSPVIKGIYDPRFAQEIKSIVRHYDALTVADILHINSSLFKMIGILLDSSTSTQWISVPHDSADILYTGDWKAWPSPFDNNHEEYYTAEPRAYAEYNFTGNGIKWYGTSNFDCGKADVILDGNHITTVDTYSPVRLTKQLLYINSRLTYDHHIIKIFCTGMKNDKATNCDVVVESFQFLSSKVDSNLETKGSPGTQIVRNAIELIHSNNGPLSIEHLAQALGVSRSYISAKFSQEMRAPPSRYINQVRLGKAKKMLLETDLPINQIASKLGYADAFSFSRIFKTAENMSPSQYRKLNK